MCHPEVFTRAGANWIRIRIAEWIQRIENERMSGAMICVFHCHSMTIRWPYDSAGAFSVNNPTDNHVIGQAFVEQNCNKNKKLRCQHERPAKYCVNQSFESISSLSKNMLDSWPSAAQYIGCFVSDHQCLWWFYWSLHWVNISTSVSFPVACGQFPSVKSVSSSIWSDES